MNPPPPMFAESSSVPGIPVELPCRESQPPAPRSPDGASTFAAAHYARALSRLHGIDTVVLRYFKVLGPGEAPESEYAAVVPKVVTAGREGRQPTINGAGDISRDFTYVDDVVEANLLTSRPSSPSALTCNDACGSRHSLLELLQATCDAAGRRVEPMIAPPRAGDIIHSHADISIAGWDLGYGVLGPSSEGIAETATWYRDWVGGRARGPERRLEDRA